MTVSPRNPRRYSRAYTPTGKGKHIQCYIDKDMNHKLTILSRIWKRPIGDIYKQALQELLERNEKEISYDRAE